MKFYVNIEISVLGYQESHTRRVILVYKVSSSFEKIVIEESLNLGKKISLKNLHLLEKIEN